MRLKCFLSNDQLTVTPFSVANLHERIPDESCDNEDDEKRISSNCVKFPGEP